MSSYTPGPWIVDRNIPRTPTIRGGKDYKIGIGNVREEDAQLIAAAPDLLEAAEALLNPDIPDCDNDGCYLCTAKQLARVALAKVKGEA